MKYEFISKLGLLCIMLFLLTPTASADERDAEEARLYNKLLIAFYGKEDTSFYKACAEYRAYVKSKNYTKEYYTSWNNEIIYDINHDNYYQALKKTEILEKDIKDANAMEHYHLVNYLMGVFYGTKGNYELCKEYMTKALQQTDPVKNDVDQIAIYQMLANGCIFDKGKEGLQWADKAIALCKTNYALCGTLGLKAMIAFCMNERELFQTCYQEIETIKAKAPKENLSFFDDYLQMGKAVFEGDLEKGIQYTDSFPGETERLQFKAVIYKTIGDQKAENEVLHQLLNIQQRHYNDITIMTAKEISRDLEVQRERSERRKAYYTAAAIAFAALCAIIALLAQFGWTRRKLLKEMQKQNEELKRANDRAKESDRMKTAFIRNVSHQMRTPLNVVSGFSTILTEQLEELSDEEKKDLTSRIRHNSELINHGLNHLISLSDIQSSNETDMTETVNCNEMLRSVAKEFDSSEETVKFHFTTTVDDSQTICTNDRLLKSIVTELLLNADKFTEEGSITLGSELQDGHWLISVTDTGTGIRQGEESKIFETFEKADDFTEGLGLGLAFCKNVLIKLGGSIALDKDYHDGARFIVSLPLC